MPTLRRGDAARAAPGPRRDPARRDARPRDDRAPRSPRPRPATSCSARCTRPARRARSTASSTRSRPSSRSRSACSSRVSLIAVISQVLDAARPTRRASIAAFEVMVDDARDREPHPQERDVQDPERRSRPARSSGWSCSTTTCCELRQGGRDHARGDALERRRTRARCARSSRIAGRLMAGRYRYTRTQEAPRADPQGDEGVVHEGQIQEALAVQSKEGGQIGQILVQLGLHRRGRRSQQALGRAGRAARSSTSTTVELAPDAARAGRRRDGARSSASCRSAREGGDARSSRSPTRMNTARARRPALHDGRRRSKAALAPTRRSTRSSGSTTRRRRRSDIAPRRASRARPAKGSIDDAEAMARSAPVVRLLNYILLPGDPRPRRATSTSSRSRTSSRSATASTASLYEIEAPPPHLALALISRIKVMASLDIAETRAAAGRPHRARDRRPAGRPARLDAADDVRRVAACCACSTGRS